MRSNVSPLGMKTLPLAGVMRMSGSTLLRVLRDG